MGLAFNQITSRVSDCLQQLPKLSFGGQALSKADTLYRNGDYEACKNMLLAYLEKHADDTEALKRVGLCYDKLEQTQEAIAAFTTSLEQDTNDTDTLYNIAREYAKLNKADIALGYLEFCEDLLSEEAQTDLDVLYLKACLFEDLNRQTDALEVLKSILEADPEHSCRLYYADLLLNAERYEEAVIELETFLAQSSQNLEARFLLCSTYGKLGYWQDVITAGENILKQHPKHAETCNQIGLAYYAQENYGGAIDYYQQALEENPDFELALNNLAYTQLKSEDYEAALETFEHLNSLLAEDSDEKSEVEEQISFIRSKLELD